MSQFVWYLGYGSNLSSERFNCYIQGGKPIYSTKNNPYNGMADSTPPKDSCLFHIPFEIYFAKRSPSWNNQGVAFLDESKSGDTLGRMWLIKRTQYDELRILEGETWYNTVISLGQKDGMPIYTITHNVRYTPDVAPSERYWRTMEEGLAEIVGEEIYRKYINQLRNKYKV